MKKYYLVSLLSALMLTGTGALAQESSSGGGNAGLFIEPGVTYESGKSTLDWPAPLKDSTGDVKGFGLVARLGFHVNDALFVGGDARYSKPNFKNSANNYDATAESMNLGAVVGMQMPVAGLRVWGEYIFMGSLDPAASHSVDVKFEDAKGYRIGVGFHVAMVSLNLEYQKLSYGKSTLQQIGTIPVGSSLGKLDDEAYIASVTFPLAL